MLKGIPASPGIAIGKAFTHKQGDTWFDWRELDEGEVEPEVNRFLQALTEVAGDVEQVRQRIQVQLGQEQARIFEAHLLMLKDPLLSDATVSRIRDMGTNAEYAFYHTVRDIRRRFESIEDEYYRARAGDILDVERRVPAQQPRDH